MVLPGTNGVKNMKETFGPFIIENNLLYTTDYKMINKLMAEAPLPIILGMSLLQEPDGG